MFERNRNFIHTGGLRGEFRQLRKIFIEMRKIERKKIGKILQIVQKTMKNEDLRSIQKS